MNLSATSIPEENIPDINNGKENITAEVKIFLSMLKV